MMNNMVKKDLTQEIGSRMSGNFVCIRDTLTIREAMSELVRQAGVHDNIATLYVVDAGGVYAGAIDLKDLIIARENDRLADIIRRGYPYVFANERTADCAERIADYEEDSLPVLTEDRHIAGVLTAQALVELVDDAIGDDYAKLGGLTSEEDLREPVLVSMKKRLPWLIALLFLGMGVSSVVGVFESVVAVLPVVICFQSLVLDMAGNVGTQSLAVTIRVLMDEKLTWREELALLGKEMRVGRVPGRNGSGVSGRLHPRVQGLRVAVRIPHLRLRGGVAGGGHGHLQPGGNSYSYAVPQDPHRPCRGLRPADHHRQRSGGRGDLLWAGAGVSGEYVSYLRENGKALLSFPVFMRITAAS